MMLEEAVVRFFIHGIGLGYLIGLIKAWNEKVLVGLLAGYFALTLVLVAVVPTGQIASSIMPSGLVLIVQIVGALIGISAGKASYKSAFE